MFQNGLGRQAHTFRLELHTAPHPFEQHFQYERVRLENAMDLLLSRCLQSHVIQVNNGSRLIDLLMHKAALTRTLLATSFLGMHTRLKHPNAKVDCHDLAVHVLLDFLQILLALQYAADVLLRGKFCQHKCRNDEL